MRTCEQCGKPIPNPRAKRFCCYSCRSRFFKPVQGITEFMRKVRKTPDGCWIWLGSHGKRYGRFQGRQAHHFSFMYFKGFKGLPRGLELDHVCRNHYCVNPAHLELVTHKQNVFRGLQGHDPATGRFCNRGAIRLSAK